jgi:hypothetical protein
MGLWEIAVFIFVVAAARLMQRLTSIQITFKDSKPLVSKGLEEDKQPSQLND